MSSALLPAVGGLSNRRREVVRAAAQVFATNRFRGTTMQQLAAAAGISRPALYLHYPTKVELYRAAAQEAVLLAEEAVLDRLRATGVPLARRVSGAAAAWLDHDVDRWVVRDLPDLPGSCLPELRAVVAAHHRSLVCALERSAGGVGGDLARTVLTLAVGARVLSPSREERARTLHEGVALLVGPTGRAAGRHDLADRSRG